MEVISMECCVEKAVALMLWIMRTQPFKDGNKRVATLAANKILIEDGKGLLQVPVETILEFKKLLIEKVGREEANKRIYATTDAAKGALKTLSIE